MLATAATERRVRWLRAGDVTTGDAELSSLVSVAGTTLAGATTAGLAPDCAAFSLGCVAVSLAAFSLGCATSLLAGVAGVALAGVVAGCAASVLATTGLLSSVGLFSS